MGESWMYFPLIWNNIRHSLSSHLLNLVLEVLNYYFPWYKFSSLHLPFLPPTDHMVIVLAAVVKKEKEIKGSKVENEYIEISKIAEHSL